MRKVPILMRMGLNLLFDQHSDSDLARKWSPRCLQSDIDCCNWEEHCTCIAKDETGNRKHTHNCFSFLTLSSQSHEMSWILQKGGKVEE